jgi:hypothetical protein
VCSLLWSALMYGARPGFPFAFIGLVLVAGVACGGAGSGGGASDPPISLDYQVTYKPGTVVMKSADVARGLESVSADGATFTLDASTPGLASVSAGTVLVMPGVALAKVTGVTPNGSTVVLATEPAAITDAIEEGSIQWEQAIGPTATSPGSAPFARPMAFGVHPLGAGVSVTPTGGSYSGTLDGYAYKITLTPGADAVSLELTVTYKDANFEASVTGKGTLSGFRSSADIEIHQGVLQQASATARNLSGSVTLTWAAGKPAPTKSSAETAVTLKIPFKWTNVIPILDGIPIIYSIGADISITPLFEGGDSSSQGSVTVPFGGTVTMTPTGGSGTVQGEPTIDTSSTTIALAPSGFVAGVSFPSVGVGLGFSEANVMMDTKVITVATTHTPGGVSGNLCETFDTTVTWVAGGSATLFGFSGSTTPVTLYTNKGTLTIPAGASCP